MMTFSILRQLRDRLAIAFRREPAPCSATAAYCRCVLTGPHAVHACDPAKCTGRWVGDSVDAPDWRPVVMPMPVRLRS